MGKQLRWLAKIFAIFGIMVGFFGIGTFTRINGITSAIGNFFDFDSNTESDSFDSIKRSGGKRDKFIF